MILLLCCGISCRKGVAPIETEEGRDVRMAQAREWNKEGKTSEAVRAYESLIRERPDTALACLELAVILHDKGGGTFTNLLKAAYYYQRYLEDRPDAEKRAVVERRMQDASRALAGVVMGMKPVITPLPDPLRRPVAGNTAVQDSRAATGRSTTVTTMRATTVTTVRATTYTVQNGDSLSTIASKVYGDSEKWTKIYEANRDLLRTANDLKIGQVLKVP